MRKALYFVIAGMVAAKNIAHDFRLRRLDKTNVQHVPYKERT